MAVRPEVNEGKGGSRLPPHHLPRDLPLKANVAVLDRPSQAESRVGPRTAEPAQPPSGPPGEQGLKGVVEAQGGTEPPVFRPKLPFAESEEEERFKVVASLTHTLG